MSSPVDTYENIEMTYELNSRLDVTDNTSDVAYCTRI